MKSLFLSLACCMMGAVAGAQTVTVADVEALPGETVTFAVNLSGGKADTYTAMQFDVQFPATGFSTTSDYSVSSLWKNATSTIGSVDAAGVATIPVASSEAISAADVEGLLTVSFTVGSDVALGDYDVTLKNLWFGYGTSSKDYADDVTFQVKVVEHHTIVLDENSTIVPEAASDVNVRVLRTIAAGNWSTICLPFAMSEAQVKSAFGEDVQLGDFVGCDVDDETGDISVNFSKVTAIEANYPYIIKVSEAITELSVEGVDIAPEEEPVVDRDEVTTGSGRNKVTTYNSFFGTYVAETVIPDYALFISGNKFWFSTGNTRIKAFRAYFDLATAGAEYDEGAEAPRLNLNFVDEVTGIGEVRSGSSGKDESCYDLLGRKRQGTSEKGLFIMKGKKVIVK